MRKTLLCGAVIAGIAALPVAASAHSTANARKSSALLPTPGIAKNLELVTPVPLGAAISGEFAHTGNYFYVSLVNGVAALDTTNPATPAIRDFLPQAEFENEAMTYGERRVPVDAAHPDGFSRFVIVGNDLVNGTLDPRGSAGAGGIAQRGRIGGGEAIVVDVSNPDDLHVAGRSPGSSTTPGVITTSTHTLQCTTIRCDYAYTAGDNEEFSIVDLRDITKPVQVKTIRSAAAGKTEIFKSGAGHYWDMNLDTKLAWHTGSGGAEVYNIADPLNPKPLNGTNAQGTQTPYNDFILHNSMRPNGTAFRSGAAPSLRSGNVLLATEEDYFNDGDEPICTNAGTFQTWGIPDFDGGRYADANADGSTPDKGTIGVLDTISAPLESGAALNTPAGAFCSAHWFDYHQSGIVAQGFYQQGLHLIDVSNPRDVRSYGYYTPTGTEVWDAYFVPERNAAGEATGRKTDLVYTADATRGVDVLRASLPGRSFDADTAGADGTGGGVNARAAKPGDSNLGPNGTATPAGTAADGRKCTSRRAFTIRLGKAKGKGKLRSARVTVAGKRVKTRRRNGRLTARVNLRGKVPAKFTVTIVGKTRSGKTVRSKRTYRTCVPKGK